MTIGNEWYLSINMLYLAKGAERVAYRCVLPSKDGRKLDHEARRTCRP
jgi:hypothetical protein